MTDKLSFPIALSDSSLTAFRNCEQLSLWSKFRNLTADRPNVHFHSGGCFAAALEAARRSFYIDGNDMQKAKLDGIRALWLAWGDFETDEREQKTWQNTTHAYLHYLKTWPFDEDYLRPWDFGHERKGIEFNFSIPIDVNHPETGEPILIEGRADMFAEFQKTPWVEDDKSTKAIGPTWADQWKLSSQMRTYTWAANEYGIPAPGAIVRVVSIQVKQNKDAEAITPYTRKDIADWKTMTVTTIKDMIRSWQRGYFRPAFNYTCRTCAFTTLCEASEPDKWMMYYKQREKRA